MLHLFLYSLAIDWQKIDANIAPHQMVDYIIYDNMGGFKLFFKCTKNCHIAIFKYFLLVLFHLTCAHKENDIDDFKYMIV
jgi:hypothetical protein